MESMSAEAEADEDPEREMKARWRAPWAVRKEARERPRPPRQPTRR